MLYYTFKKQNRIDIPIIYIDLECYSKKETNDHIPNLYVAEYSYNDKQIIFEDKENEIMNKFGNWLFTKEHKDYTVIAHNFKGYDGHFIKSWLIKNGFIIKTINNGCKIMYMKYKQLNMT